RDAVATVQATQVFENTGPGQVEATFVFPLPYDGAIDQLTLMVDGKEFAGKLLSREEARRRYEEIVRSSRDPALLEWVGQGMFQTSVFPIPPGAKRTVTLRYTQVCRQSQGLADFLFPLAPAKYTSGKLDKLSVRVAIESGREIKSVYSPSHAIDLQRPDDRHAIATLEAKDVLPAEDFRLFYSAAEGDVAASVVSYRPEPSEDGYFMVLATPTLDPPDEKRQAKTVVFVVDRSGSMSGEKMEQAREALKFVLNNLREGDTFNIVAYDSEVETFRPELEKFNSGTRDAALGFVNGLFAGGTTNIDGALDRALGMLQDDQRPAYVIFLTDGVPTFGETSEAKIVASAVEANKVRARLFAFGVGYDLNSRLLDKLARAGHGVTEFVRPEEDIETAVSSLYRRIGAPVMTEVELSIDVEGAREADGAAANRLYPRGPLDLFSGDQAVLVGRYRTGGSANVRLRGKLAGKDETLSFPAELVADSDDDANAFVAKLWATRRVGEIIDQIDLDGHNDELVKELVELATRHGILTPYTSFLADDAASAMDSNQATRTAGERLESLAQTDGDYGFRQREAKAAMQIAAAPTSGGFGGSRGLAGGTMAADAAAGPSSASGPALARGGAELLAERGGRGVTYYDAEADEHRVAQNVITIGRKTFFRRGERWVDSSVSAEEEKSATAITRYSDEYFGLAERYGAHVAAYLAIDEPVTVKVGGKVFSW
ncbi:MAG TPA: VIT domain-containing protein, partial [Lacipirellulaceae bacterium]|nr:VIT domain-containing protein [Lacipirellulaceae bacterium]